jgi:hypothetical protein
VRCARRMGIDRSGLTAPAQTARSGTLKACGAVGQGSEANARRATRLGCSGTSPFVATTGVFGPSGHGKAGRVHLAREHRIHGWTRTLGGTRGRVGRWLSLSLGPYANPPNELREFTNARAAASCHESFQFQNYSKRQYREDRVGIRPRGRLDVLLRPFVTVPGSSRRQPTITPGDRR